MFPENVKKLLEKLVGFHKIACLLIGFIFIDLQFLHLIILKFAVGKSFSNLSWLIFKSTFWMGSIKDVELNKISLVFNTLLGYLFLTTFIGIAASLFTESFKIIVEEWDQGGKTMKKISKWLASIFIFLLIIVVIVSIILKKPDKAKITWGGPKNIAMVPIIAQEKGFFEKMGLNAHRQDIQTGKMTMDALIRGSIDFGVLVETNIAFIEFQPEAKLKIIAIIEEKFDDAILALRSHGINYPKDLEGKRIGITYATTSHAFAVSFLKSLDIDLNKVTFVNMPPPSIQAGLINGSLDAGTLWQPFRYNVKSEIGRAVIEFNDTTVYKAFSIIVVRKDFAQKKTKEIEQFLTALIDAEKYLNTHLNESQRILSKEINIPLSTLKVIWDEYKLRIHLSGELLSAIKKEGKWIIETQSEFKNKPLPDYKETIATKFLRKIDQSRVTGL